MEEKNLLPLGSVVSLKKGNKKIMICARFQISKQTMKYYDYAACYYPEGMIESDKLFMFQHDDIEQIYFQGFIDQEEVNFIQKVSNYLIE